MPRHLHIQCDDTRNDFVGELLRLENERPECQIIRIRLKEKGTDYQGLLEEIFLADTVTVW